MTTQLSRSNYQYLLVNQEDRVAIIQLNRPEALNALSPHLMAELVEVMESFDQDDSVGCMVLTGCPQVFSAGADIKCMAEAFSVEMLLLDSMARWDRIGKLRKPVIAAINGYALGGGSELAMLCDIIIAGECAKFGEAEINIGVIPGAGGTQRLTRALGKVKAMELILTGQLYGADEALRMGLINRIVPTEQTLAEAKALATIIANQPAIAVRLAKEAILKAFETTLEGGVDYERKLFYMLFSSEDQKEGMRAFMEKRTALWQHR